MVLDVALGAILLLSVVTAGRSGFTREALGIAGLVFGILFSMWGYGLLARELGRWIEDGKVAAVVAFAAIFLASLIGGGLIARVLAGVWEWSGLRWIDMTLGAAFGLLRGLLICSVVILGLIVFQPFDGTPGLVAGSRIAPWVINIARTAVSVAPSGVRAAFQAGIDEVERMRDDDST